MFVSDTTVVPGQTITISAGIFASGSTVTFTSADAVPQEALNAAVTEAGYTLAEVTNT